ncbi:MAG: 16S rRNA (adenine(1518)-N(6)/adenine(1519)-N(6))-dimethyltransferase RsmA [Candidatus Moranbacteria bacterium]|nr:16S rRNA (adenine(1518)-N(6)/adenine(1519)-N(6))-dimethyltransferase RsmA [Candidatus Moranbacteria bacterium]
MPTKLGQNFLTDESVAKKIVESAKLSKKDNVLEVGPGKGILTKYLAEKAGRILAVEIDEKLAEKLLARFCHSCANRNPEKFKLSQNPWIPGLARDGKIKIITGDILKINLPETIESNNFGSYKVVANLPYYITSKIIRLFLETKYPPREMIFMIQKEVAERIVALDKKESILSISVKFYADPEIVFYVPKEKFKPIPEVDSAVIKLKRKNKIPNIDTKIFFHLVRTGFSSKRKKLINNLSSGLHLPKEEISGILKKSGIDPEVRAEKLSIENWIKLADFF